MARQEGWNGSVSFLVLVGAFLVFHVGALCCTSFRCGVSWFSWFVSCFLLVSWAQKKSYHGCVYVVGGWTGGGEGHSPWLCVCSGWVDWGVTRVEL